MAIDIWRTRPYGTFSTPLRQWVDRVFDDAFARETGTGEGSAGFQSLPVNVWETPEGYQAALLAPGLDEQSINATVQEDPLTIEGELRVQAPEGARVVWQGFRPRRLAGSAQPRGSAPRDHTVWRHMGRHISRHGVTVGVTPHVALWCARRVAGLAEGGSPGPGRHTG